MSKVTGKNLIGAIALSASLAITGCATAESHSKEAMAAKEAPMMSDALTAAEADLKAAIAAGGEWRVIDKATGGKAVNISKLLKVAQEKAKAGETEEADRIAAHVSQAAKTGAEQAKRYANATPYYN